MTAPYDIHKISSTALRILRASELCACLYRQALCLVVLLIACLTSNANPVDPAASVATGIVADSTEVRFRKSRADIDLLGNKERLDNLMRQIRKISGQDSTYVLSTLRVIGSASPEGSDEINRRLSEQRAQALFDYFADHISFPDSLSDFEYLGRNWKGLYLLVASDPAVPAQSEVLDLLRPATSGVAITSDESDRLLSRLKALKGGVPYAYMYRHLFPALRYSFLYVEYEKRMHREIEKLMLKTIEADETALRNDSLSTSDAAEGFADEATEIMEIIPGADNLRQNQTASGNLDLVDAGRNFYMALRTNMLLDIAAIPNLGAEFYLGKNFSIIADWMYSWWSLDRRHRYWRLYGGNLGLRWWFGKRAAEKPLSGHHVGIYGGALIFDFEWGKTGYMGGKPGTTLWDRCLVNAGIEYGYSLPIGRRFNIDFSIGLGYLSGKYIKYFPFDNEYYREKEFKLNYFGPTKAEISLVWLIGRGNVNNRKGGDR